MADDTDSNEEVVLFDVPVPEAVALLNESNLGNGFKLREKEHCTFWQKIMGKSKFPTCVYFILGSEFCERFSYYGLKTILVIYLTKWLMFSSDDATIIYHSFSMLCYFSPILGAIIADGYLGRFKTIMYLSVVYGIGNTVLALTALPPAEPYGPIIGLLLIGIGTGGIKPCVSAMGGDQFSSDQVQERLAFFSVFYFMINLGSMLSTIVTPILRADIHCIGNTCYPLAFGIPAILMIIALVIFFLGRNEYKRVSLSGNIIGEVCRCVFYAIKKKFTRSKTEKQKLHWLDYSEGKYEIEFISDVKDVVKVLWLFLPLPVFWALFDQQGSRWTLQAEQMDGSVGNLGRIKPDQLQVLNPILILIFIPIFTHIIYPTLDKFHIPNRPLQKMIVGMIFCCLAFVVAGFVQMKLDTYTENSLGESESGTTFINTVNCNITYTSSIYNHSLHYNQMSNFIRFQSKENNLVINSKCNKTGLESQFTGIFHKKQHYLLVTMATDSSQYQIKQYKSNRKKPKEGKAKVRILSGLPKDSIIHITNIKDKTVTSYNTSQYNITDYISIEPGSYTIYIEDTGYSSNISSHNHPETYKLGSGAVYTLIITSDNTQTSTQTKKLNVLLYNSVKVNEMSMFYMVPQFIIITIGEVLFSITGLSFAYSEAPQSMKSVVQAGWLTTVACGNFIVVFVAEISIIPSQTAEYFLFAVLMGLDIIIFSVMCCFYKYAVQRTSTSDIDTDALVSKHSDEDIPLSDTNDSKAKYS